MKNWQFGDKIRVNDNFWYPSMENNPEKPDEGAIGLVLCPVDDEFEMYLVAFENGSVWPVEAAMGDLH